MDFRSLVYKFQPGGAEEVLGPDLNEVPGLDSVMSSVPVSDLISCFVSSKLRLSSATRALYFLYRWPVRSYKNLEIK